MPAEYTTIRIPKEPAANGPEYSCGSFKKSEEVRDLLDVAKVSQPPRFPWTLICDKENTGCPTWNTAIPARPRCPSGSLPQTRNQGVSSRSGTSPVS